MDDPSSISVPIVGMIYGTLRGSQGVRGAMDGWMAMQPVENYRTASDSSITHRWPYVGPHCAVSRPRVTLA